MMKSLLAKAGATAFALVLLAAVGNEGSVGADSVQRLWHGPTTFAVQLHIRRLNVPYFRRAVEAGFDAVRIPLVPWWAQHTDGTWMWTNYDAMYAWLRRRGVTPLFVLQNPRDRGDLPSMLEFAREAGARFPDALLELGNEPDNPKQWPAFYRHAATGLTAQAYWDIEKRFAAAWREGSPRARIATAGTSGIDFDWQRALIGAIEKDGAFSDGTISALGVHTYGEPLPPHRARHGDVIADLASLKAMLPAGVDVWVTEYGLIDPRPEDVAGWLSTMDALGVGLFSWYEIQDDVLDGDLQRYGLFTLDGTAKPAYDAARSFLRGRAEHTQAVASPTPAAF